MPEQFISLTERKVRREAKEREAARLIAQAEAAKDMRVTVDMALGRERLPRPVELAAADLGWVYFIQAPCGSIKIGRARNVAYRLAELQCGNPGVLSLLAAAVDGRREAEYHRQFKEYRTRGEWFSPHADILAEVEHIAQRIGAV